MKKILTIALLAFGRASRYFFRKRLRTPRPDLWLAALFATGERLIG